MATFTTEQHLPVTFKVLDGRGRPAPIDGDPVLASSDETVAAPTEFSNDGSGNYSFKVSSVAEGSARITITGDANLGPDISEIVGVLDVEVTTDPRTGARTIELVAGDPVDE